SLRCEMMLYMASRAQLVEERIRRALSRAELVLADRFVTSTRAYQRSAGGLPFSELMPVAQAACGPARREHGISAAPPPVQPHAPSPAPSAHASARAPKAHAHHPFSAWPDLVVIFDVDEVTAGGRLNPLLDRMEAKGIEFHRRVRMGYLEQ